MSEWISVYDRLPESRKTEVLTYNSKYKIIGVGSFGVLGEEIGWWDSCGCKEKLITHWMPLPDPPKEDK